MACQRILVSSEQYCMCMQLEYSRWMMHGDILFISKDGQKGYRKKSVLDLHKHRDDHQESLQFSASGWDITLEKGYPLRLVGHVLNFLDGEDLLFDINLKDFGEREHVRLFSADGNLMIGEEEYLFAPAHSTALICRNEKSFEKQYRFAYTLNRQPICVQLDCSNAAQMNLYVWSGRNSEAKCSLTRQEGNGALLYTGEQGQIGIRELDAGIKTGKLIPVQACGSVRTKSGQTIRLQEQIGIGFKGA